METRPYCRLLAVIAAVWNLFVPGLVRAEGDPAPATVIVLPFSARAGADPAAAGTLKGLLIDQLFFARCASVASDTEVAALLAKNGLEAKCAADANACAVEAARAAPSDFIVVGDLLKAGDRRFLSLQLIRSKRQQTVYRQRVETGDAFLTEDATAVFQHLASGFTCLKEERFAEPAKPLRLVPVNLRAVTPQTPAPQAPKPAEPAVPAGNGAEASSPSAP